jgi:hypothetical protein
MSSLSRWDLASLSYVSVFLLFIRIGTQGNTIADMMAPSHLPKPKSEASSASLEKERSLIIADTDTDTATAMGKL